MTHRNEVLTGAFVLAGLALILAGALWLSDAGLGARDLELTARFQTVGALKPGNQVTLRGVPVGKVERIALAADGGAVEVTFRVRSEVSLPEDPVVIIQPSSLFGEWQAVITPVGEWPELGADTGDLPPGRVPGVTMAAFSEISESSREIAENLRGLTERFEVAFNEGTARDLARAISNFSRASDEMIGMLERQREEFGSFTADLAEAGDAVRRAAADLDSTVSRLAAATEEGELQAIFDNAREASASLRDVSSGLRGTLGDLDRGIARADSAVREVQALLATVNRGEGSIGRLAHDQVLYENTAAALAELRALLDDLKKNPRRYFNFSVF